MLFYTRLDFEDASIVGELAGLSLSPNNIISTLERKKRMMGQVTKLIIFKFYLLTFQR